MLNVLFKKKKKVNMFKVNLTSSSLPNLSAADKLKKMNRQW